MTESKRGGARKGSGRKPKDPTTTINFRVPIDKVPLLKPLVSAYIKGLLNNPPNRAIETPLSEIKNETAIKKPAIIKKEAEPTKAELWAQMKNGAKN
jgi:hypothetical protein